MESVLHQRLDIGFSFDKTGSCESFENVDFSCTGDLKAVICSDVRELRFNTMLKKKETRKLTLAG